MISSIRGSSTAPGNPILAIDSEAPRLFEVFNHAINLTSDAAVNRLDIDRGDLDGH